MNYMEEVAKLLGVELDEEFYLEENGVKRPYLYKLTMDGMPYYNEEYKMWEGMGFATLGRILGGEISIIKQLCCPYWKPQTGELYYYCASCYPTWDIESTVQSMRFNNEPIDWVHVKIGNCFKTEEEARKYLPAFEAWIDSKPITDWRDSDEEDS